MKDTESTSRDDSEWRERDWRLWHVVDDFGNEVGPGWISMRAEGSGYTKALVTKGWSQEGADHG